MPLNTILMDDVAERGRACTRITACMLTSTRVSHPRGCERLRSLAVLPPVSKAGTSSTLVWPDFRIINSADCQCRMNVYDTESMYLAPLLNPQYAGALCVAQALITTYL